MSNLVTEKYPTEIIGDCEQYRIIESTEDRNLKIGFIGACDDDWYGSMNPLR